MKKCSLIQDDDRMGWYVQEERKLDKAILNLKLAKPALRALINAKIYSLPELIRFKKDNLKALHGIGPASLKKLNRLFK